MITARLSVVVDPASSARRENPAAMKTLDTAIAQIGKAQVIEQVAYTWFNRFVAFDNSGEGIVRLWRQRSDDRHLPAPDAMAGHAQDLGPAAAGHRLRRLDHGARH